MTENNLKARANLLAMDCLYQAMKLRHEAIENHKEKGRLIEIATNYEHNARYLLELRKNLLQGESS